MRLAATAALAAAALATPAAAATPLPRLPAPSFTSSAGGPTALSAAGPRVALAVGCTVRLMNLSRGASPVRVRLPGGDCASDPGDSWVFDLRLGRTALAATTIISPSPHGDGFSQWTGPATGPLHEVGGGWGWRDDDVPHGSGCAWSVAAG